MERDILYDTARGNMPEMFMLFTLAYVYGEVGAKVGYKRVFNTWRMYAKNGKLPSVVEDYCLDIRAKRVKYPTHRKAEKELSHQRRYHAIKDTLDKLEKAKEKK